MKFLLIGRNGQLGWELQRTCMTLGEVIATDYPDVDISQTAALRDLIRTVKPDILLNPAAYTNVDKAESEIDLARKVNSIAPGIMAEEMQKLGGALIHYSTDYVFDGEKGTSYVETDAANPINAYGITKLEGEQVVHSVAGIALTFRTCWVYSLRVGGFVNKVLGWARQQEVMRIVDDQIGSPTWARMLAEATAHVIARGGNDPLAYLQQHSGLYHLAGDGAASRYEWAREVIDQDPKKEEQVVRQIIPAKSEEFPNPAHRPVYSALDCSKFKQTFGFMIPDWKDSIKLLLS
ncbi:MAG TPA: dTDP-4-dehydrorhamnose reductase [Anaerolineaceae bacterium]|nr:dTDP-4-dehydrorhamnose reductase [Anaerolineaceae bacterium]